MSRAGYRLQIWPQFCKERKIFFFQAYIDYNDMAKSLHDKFPEYKRIKFKAFKDQVEECFNRILEALNKQSESPEKETPKETSKEKEAPKEAPKGQLISEWNFAIFNFPKKTMKKIWRISALESKKWWNQK